MWAYPGDRGREGLIQKGPDSNPMPTDVVVMRAEEKLGATEKPITAIIVLDYIDAKEIFQILSQLRDRTALISLASM